MKRTAVRGTAAPVRPSLAVLLAAVLLSTLPVAAALADDAPDATPAAAPATGTPAPQTGEAPLFGEEPLEMTGCSANAGCPAGGSVSCTGTSSCTVSQTPYCRPSVTCDGATTYCTAFCTAETTCASGQFMTCWAYSCNCFAGNDEITCGTTTYTCAEDCGFEVWCMFP